MIRIVRSGAETLDIIGDTELRAPVYDASDTVLLDKNWRPEETDAIRDKLNPHSNLGYTNRDYGDRRVWADGFEAGFQACLEAIERK